MELANYILEQHRLGTREVLHALELLLVEEPHLTGADAAVRVQIDTSVDEGRRQDIRMGHDHDNYQRVTIAGLNEASDPIPGEHRHLRAPPIGYFRLVQFSLRFTPEPVLKCCV